MDDMRRRLLEQTGGGVTVRQVELLELESGRPLEPVQAGAFQCGVVVVVQIVYAHDRFTALEQRMGDEGADEAGYAGDEDGHSRASTADAGSIRFTS